MTRVQPKAIPNWCPQVKPDEPWTGRCVKEKIAADGKRHRCHKTEKHTDAVHARQCGLEWKQFKEDGLHLPCTGHEMNPLAVSVSVHEGFDQPICRRRFAPEITS